MADRRILPIPRQLADAVEHAFYDFPGTASLRWTVRRMVERAYADGYEDGHSAGAREESADRRAAELDRRPANPLRGRDIESDELTAALAKHLGDTCPVWEETFSSGPGLVMSVFDAAVAGAKFLAAHAAERGLDA